MYQFIWLIRNFDIIKDIQKKIIYDYIIIEQSYSILNRTYTQYQKTIIDIRSKYLQDYEFYCADCLDILTANTVYQIRYSYKKAGKTNRIVYQATWCYDCFWL